MFRLILIWMALTYHCVLSDSIIDALKLLREEQNTQRVPQQHTQHTTTNNKTESIPEHGTVTINNHNESTASNRVEQNSVRNNFEKLYVQLKENHENQLKKWQREHDLLKEKLLVSSSENFRLKSLNCNSGPINLNVSCHMPDCKINPNDNNTLLNSVALQVDEIHKLLTTKAITKTSKNLYSDTVVRKERTRGKYVGCFQDHSTYRLMKGYIRRMKLNHVELCVDLCRKGNFVYAGLGHEWCFCDNTIPETKHNYKLTDTFCDTPCAGNQSQMCGHSFVNSVYETGIEQYLLNEEGNQLGDSYLEPSPNNYYIVGGSLNMDD